MAPNSSRRALASAMVGVRFLIIATLTSLALAQAQPAADPGTGIDNSIRIGERHSLHSDILKEERPYLVYLPQSYRSKEFAPKRYPVLYLLDGDAHFQSASGVVQFMSEGINGNLQTPELIVVAIPNTDRTRDLTPTHTLKDYEGKDSPSLAASGGGEAFLRFLSQELIPHIEAEYRTETYRILVGHSFGGLFAVYAFLHRPQIFQAHIAMDPSLWWDDHSPARRAGQLLQQTNDFSGPLYISEANNSPGPRFDPSPGKRAIESFAQLLQTNQSAVFRSKLQYFEAEDHGSVPLLSLYHGLLFVFENFKPAEVASATPALLTEHFARVSDRLGFKVLPPEQFVNNMAWYHLAQAQETNQALGLLQLNLANYPESPNVHESLAEAYNRIGELSLAREHFLAALKANPENRFAAERARRLKPSAEKSCGPLADGTYQLINKATGKSLEVAKASTNSGVPITAGTYVKAPHQQWRLHGQGDGYYEITLLHSGKAMDVNALSTRNGASIIQWPTNGGPNQVWELIPNHDGTYRLLNEHSRLALQFLAPARAGAATNGPALRQWEWLGQDNQRWRLKPVATPAK